MTFWQPRTLLALCAIGLSSSVSANLTFSGTLREPPPCTITINGGPIDFGDVGINNIDGNNYRQTVDYTLACGPGTLPWELKLSVNGTEAFETTAVQTSETDLGIRLMQNGQPFELNTPLAITLGSHPVLEAIPVKRPGAVLAAGAFQATAVLLAVYQ